MPGKRFKLEAGDRYEFMCFQFDIAGHSKLSDAGSAFSTPRSIDFAHRLRELSLHRTVWT